MEMPLGQFHLIVVGLQWQCHQLAVQRECVIIWGEMCHAMDNSFGLNLISLSTALRNVYK